MVKFTPWQELEKRGYRDGPALQNRPLTGPSAFALINEGHHQYIADDKNQFNHRLYENRKTDSVSAILGGERQCRGQCLNQPHGVALASEWRYLGLVTVEHTRILILEDIRISGHDKPTSHNFPHTCDIAYVHATQKLAQYLVAIASDR